MNEHADPTTANPFSTRRVRPGALPFVFPDGLSAERLVERLEAAGWRGQIVGPHGSGKSALLATLLPAVERCGRRPHLVSLHDGQRQMPGGYLESLSHGAPALLVVDGYEQLSRFSRWKLKRTCRRRGLGLLVTSHAPVGLPELFRTSPSAELAQQLAATLQCDLPVYVNREDIAQSFARHGGDLRETLFELYDLYEQRRRGDAAV